MGPYLLTVQEVMDRAYVPEYLARCYVDARDEEVRARLAEGERPEQVVTWILQEAGFLTE